MKKSKSYGTQNNKIMKNLFLLLITLSLISCTKESAGDPVGHNFVNIASVKITSLPFSTDASGWGWDNPEPNDNPLPDIYFTFNDADSNNFVVYNFTIIEPKIK